MRGAISASTAVLMSCRPAHHIVFTGLDGTKDVEEPLEAYCEENDDLMINSVSTDSVMVRLGGNLLFPSMTDLVSGLRLLVRRLKVSRIVLDMKRVVQTDFTGCAVWAALSQINRNADRVLADSRGDCG